MRKHVLGIVVAALCGAAAAQETFSGVVFGDANGNSQRDEGEAGVAGVSVSNGVQVVQTNEEGAYELPLLGEMTVFVSKPAGYSLPLDENDVPQFFYVHQPGGSPNFIQEYEGLEPGAHTITVRAVDPYGQEWVGTRVLEVALTQTAEVP